jgi:hypothetical protein
MLWRMAVTSEAGIIIMEDIFLRVGGRWVGRSWGRAQQTFGLDGQMVSIFILS